MNDQMTRDELWAWMMSARCFYCGGGLWAALEPAGEALTLVERIREQSFESDSGALLCEAANRIEELERALQDVLRGRISLNTADTQSEGQK